MYLGRKELCVSKDIEQMVGIDRNVMKYKSYRDAGV